MHKSICGLPEPLIPLSLYAKNNLGTSRAPPENLWDPPGSPPPHHHHNDTKHIIVISPTSLPHYHTMNWPPHQTTNRPPPFPVAAEAAEATRDSSLSCTTNSCPTETCVDKHYPETTRKLPGDFDDEDTVSSTLR